MSDKRQPGFCEQCGNPLQPGDKFCGSCGAVNLPPAPQAEKVVPEPTPPAQGASYSPRRRNRLWINAAAVSVLLLVVGAVAALALNGASGLLGGAGAEEQKLHGEWTGNYDDEAVSLTFAPDGTVQGIAGNDVEAGTYRVDMNEEPPHLDIDQGERGEVKTIFEFVDDNHIRLENNDPGKQRPDSFDDTSSIVLTRGGPSSTQQGSDTPANVPAPEEPEGSGTPEPNTPSTQQNPDEEALEEFGREYDEANRQGDWEETYAMLGEESRQQFTEEEWSEKQQALRDAEGPLSPLQSVSVDLPEGVSDTSGNVILYYQDGTSDTIVAGIPMAVTSEEEAGEPKRTLTEEEISYLEQVSTDGGTDDLVAQVEEAAGDYYRASGVQDWDYTYDALDSETKALFTREEWLQKNQYLADNGEVIYNIESVHQVGTNDEYFAVTLKLTYEDGSSSTRETYFVLEGEEWKHRFGQEEKDLFGPGVSFEEWVEDQ